jgi:hypothetical protein
MSPNAPVDLYRLPCPRTWHWSFLSFIVLALGCGTTRMSDTPRTGTEQLLISNAVDKTVSQLDFSYLAEKPVFLDAQYLDGCVDKGYLVSSLRQQLLASGCLLQEDRTKATYVVEARTGAIGTDHHALLVGVPQMTVPAVVPAQPTQIPEIPFAKKTDQQGVAKIAVFAYNRKTGRPVYQSGIVEATSNAEDTWVFGAGPFRKGTILDGTVFAGEPLAVPHLLDREASGPDAPAGVVPLTATTTWSEPAQPQTQLTPLMQVLVNAALGEPFKPIKLNATDASPSRVAAETRGSKGDAGSAAPANKEASRPPAGGGPVIGQTQPFIMSSGS